MVAYNRADLDFILAQIQLSEQHATTEDASGAPVAGTPLADLVPHFTLPYGVRTVDGTFNNLIPGQENFGAADTLFPRLIDPAFQQAGPVPTGFGSPGSTSYAQTGGNVFDAQPRTISNLIADQTLNNPAAIMAALEYAGITGADAVAARDSIITLFAAIKPLQDAATAAAAVEAAALSAKNSAQAEYDLAVSADAAAQASVTAYTNAIALAPELETSSSLATGAVGAFLSGLQNGVQTINTGDLGRLTSAITAADAAAADADAVYQALLLGPNVSPSDLGEAQAAAVDTAAVLLRLQSLQTLAAGDAFDDALTDEVSAINGLALSSFIYADNLAADLSDADSRLDAIADAATAAANLVTEAGQLATANTNYTDAVTASNDADALVAANSGDLNAALADNGIELTDNGSIVIPNVATDEGLSAPFNSWFTLFGQFFDHGLDLTTKGGNGTVFVPLQPDDPLFNPAPGAPNFMVLTRATQFAGPGADGVLGTADDTTHEAQNTTTSWVDQNQTYTSHASHQVFLREYVRDANGDPVATGALLGNRQPNGSGEYFGVGSGDLGGLATWAVVKAQARELLGINLTDADVTNVPLLATDEYGRFLRGPNGFPQVVMDLDGNGPGGETLVEGNPVVPIDLARAIRTGHAFLDDIAHTAGPKFVAGVGADGIAKTADDLAPDTDLIAGDHFDQTGVAGGATGGAYDNELLDAHKVTGDGRGNENIGLTTVHHVFHSEHNRLVEHTKELALAQNDLAFLNEWLAVDVLALPTLPSEIAALQWNGERLFQAAKFGTEMQYQHLVFEEFARKVQPLTNIFSSYHEDIDPSIVAEFAHVVYRFGHSMLNETVDLIDENGNASELGLIEAFLNPVAFDQTGVTDEDSAGAVIRGMTRQRGNEIDEFVTEALRNNLLGLPLDLATINLTRARSEGVPTLNVARREFFAATGDSQLRPYTSWVDFAEHVKNPVSVINFIAAYGTHSTITGTLEDKRAAAEALVFGGQGSPADRLDFLNASGAYAGGTLGGLDLVDFWIGGLAEAQMPFGGLLGSTFNFVFETQMEKLQDGDRFYYLARLAGTHFLTELEGNSFANLVSINTNIAGDGMHLPGDIFSVPNYILEVDQSKQITGLGITGRDDPTDDSNPFLKLVNRDDPLTAGADANYLKYTGPDHVVLGGTSGNDTLISSIGDDTVWGDAGNDRIEGGAGVDQLLGGDGDDIITDINGDDNIKGQGGNDVINSGDGFDLILAGDGHDFTIGGEDANETFGGEGNDFIFAGDDSDIVFGDGGHDWIEGGNGADLLQGDFGAPFQDSREIGNDVIIGGGGNDDYDSESGDDIMVAGPGIERNEGMSGFDWVTHKGDPLAADADMNFTGLLPPDIDAIRHRYDLVEGLSGWDLNDTLRGTSNTTIELSAIDNVSGQNNAINTQAQVDLINGLQGLLGAGVSSFSGGDIILGGGGSDLIEARGGDDIIDGDAKLNVRIGIRANADGTGDEIGTAEGMFGLVTSNNPALNGVALNALMVAGAINPGQLQIVREIIDTTGSDNGVDIALFSDARANYTISAPVDGFVTVTHNVVGGDGADRIRNVELLRFTDQTVILDNSITNAAAIDDLSIIIVKDPANSGAGPEVGDTLIVDGAVIDRDNTPTNVPLAAINFTWQVEQTAGAGDWVTLLDPITELPVTGPTFTPSVGFEIDGLALRVVGTFFDADNFPEFVASNATPPASAPLLPTIAGLIGTPGDDILVGTLDDNTFEGNGGNDLLFGLGGNDTAVFNGPSTNFVFSFTPDGVLEVNDTIAGTETAVFSIENFQFTGNNTTISLADVLLSIPTPATAGPDVLIGTAGADDIAGGLGNDTILSLADADTIAWEAGDGHDVVNAGADGLPADGVGADRFRIRGNGEDETFDVHSQTTFAAASTGLTLRGVPSDAGVTLANPIPESTSAAEVIITRTVGSLTEIVAELSGVDDITFNGGGGTDVFNLIGNLTGTDINPATIEIFGDEGDDIVNIADTFGGTRAVFHGGTGNDSMTGQRSNDIFNDVDNVEDGDDTGGDDGGDDGDDDTGGDGDDDDNANSGSGSSGSGSSAGTGGSTPTPSSFVVLLGSAASDTLVGTAGGDTLTGLAGDDTLLGLAGDDNLVGGAGADNLLGDAGRDIIFGNDGDDIILAGFDDDQVFGGSGNDTIFGDDGSDNIFGNEGRDVIDGGMGRDVIFITVNDGDDVISGGGDVDTLDMSAITTDAVVDLGSSGIGFAESLGSGHDTLDSIENVKGGAGDDTIYASNSANVLSGGAGNDNFVFRTATAANGDSIADFQPGDQVDLRPILGDDADLLSSNAVFDMAGQFRLQVSNGDTIVEGNTDNDADVDFSIKIIGRVGLNGSDFS